MEEKEAVEIQDSISILENTQLDINTIENIDLHTYNFAVKTALDLLEKKDAIIDEMAKYISNFDIDEDICKNVIQQEIHYCDEKECEDCIKQYFEKKVENSSDINAIQEEK